MRLSASRTRSFVADSSLWSSVAVGSGGDYTCLLWSNLNKADSSDRTSIPDIWETLHLRHLAPTMMHPARRGQSLTSRTFVLLVGSLSTLCRGLTPRAPLILRDQVTVGGGGQSGRLVGGAVGRTRLLLPGAPSVVGSHRRLRCLLERLGWLLLRLGLSQLSSSPELIRPLPLNMFWTTAALSFHLSPQWLSSNRRDTLISRPSP